MTKLSQEQLQLFDEQGYVILDHFFHKEETDALAARIDILAEAHERELQKLGKQGISIPGQISFTAFLHRKDPEIQKFIAQQKMVEISTSVLGPDVRLYWDQSVYKRPEAKRDFPWHQDTGYVPTMPEVYLTCWLALDDATVENGCVWVIPGSHRQGLLEHKETDVGKQCYFGEDPGVPVPLQKGSMVIFNSLLFHRSTPNLSNKIRKGYIMQYSKVGTYNPFTGQVYDNGPVIALNGEPVF